MTNITKLNLKPFLGAYCMLNIEHEQAKKDPSKIYACIGQKGLMVMPMTAGVPKPAAIKPNVYLDLDFFSWEVFKALPPFIQKKIQASKNWADIIRKNPEPVQQAEQVSEHKIDVESDINTEGDAPNF
jgi:hypothetical protein